MKLYSICGKSAAAIDPIQLKSVDVLERVRSTKRWFAAPELTTEWWPRIDMWRKITYWWIDTHQSALRVCAPSWLSKKNWKNEQPSMSSIDEQETQITIDHPANGTAWLFCPLSTFYCRSGVEGRKGGLGTVRSRSSWLAADRLRVA